MCVCAYALTNVCCQCFHLVLPHIYYVCMYVPMSCYQKSTVYHNMHIYVCTYVFLCVCTYIHTYMCMYVHTYVLTCVCTYVRMYICISICAVPVLSSPHILPPLGIYRCAYVGMFHTQQPSMDPYLSFSALVVCSHQWCVAASGV